MGTVHTALRWLRNWFVVWFVAESVIGVALAVVAIEGMRRYRFLRGALDSVSAEFTVASAVLGAMVVLVLALLVFAALLELRPWARIVLLVVGWITVVSGILNLVSMPATISWLGPSVARGSGGWIQLGAVSVLSELIDLAFWGWLIVVLQFNGAVREAFVCERPAVPHEGGG